MNASTSNHYDAIDDSADELSVALIAELQLDESTVRSIHDIMRSMHTSFVDAANRLGVLPPGAIEEALINIGSERPAEEIGLIENAIRRIATSKQVVLRQGEPVTPGPELILAHDSDNPRSERLRALRTELLLLHEAGRAANMIAIVSPGSGEGRSLLCGELAISFAQLGRRTLLVDADLRRPRQHLLFGSTNDHGLSQAIARNEKPYYHPVVGLPTMHLLTGGPVPRNPLELLSDGRFGSLMNEWRNSYEFVVLDTPPITDFADGLAVAALAARALLLSRARHTTFASTRALMRRLDTTQSRLLGAVINHF